MTTKDKILSIINTDTSLITDHIYDLCELMGIYEWLTQKEPLLGYRNYHNWICTDTEVGINVWYFNNDPVAISYNPYRKYGTSYYWLSKEHYINVKNYLHTLQNENDNSMLLVDNMPNIIDQANSINHKKFEKFNV